MKRRLLSVGLVAVAAAVLAFSLPVERNRPPLTLPVAYGAAIEALGAATNYLYCVGAFVSENRKGSWVFRFYSTNAVEKYVTVPFGGEAYVRDSYSDEP